MFKFSSNTRWLLLLIATGLTYWLGESGQLDYASMAPVFLIFGLRCSRAWALSSTSWTCAMHPRCGAIC